MASNKFVYYFGNGKADGTEAMKELLGGKGANLAEMVNIGIPVPAGFTITTEVCTWYYDHGRKLPIELKAQVEAAIAKVEKSMGKKFGDVKNPLLLSVRSGARASMPGMMDTVLNVGLTEKTIPGLIAKSGSARFAYDSYRRLIMMYSDVVMEKAAGIEPKDGVGIRKVLDERLGHFKKSKGYKIDTDLTVEDLQQLCAEFKIIVKDTLGKEFPDDPHLQIWGGIQAVFESWNGKRACEYRRIEKIPDWWGTAVNVQAMVFGNMGDNSATGVAFTRNPGNGDAYFYGEYLVNAQGEDVVAGIRTPAPINDQSKNDQSRELPTLEKVQPKCFKELNAIQKRLEKHYKNMLDIEFTIEEGVLYMLQCRVGKRNGTAAVKIAIDMYKEKLIDAETAVMRVGPNQLVELLLPMLDPKVEATTKPIAKGLPAGPGGATGRAVFSSEDAVAWAARGEKVILLREETSPEDVDGMHKAEAILTSKGGMTSHAALVARGWGKCCVVGCSDLEVSKNHAVTKSGVTIKEGDWVSLNGTKGLVYIGNMALVDIELSNNTTYRDLMKLCDEFRTLKIRTNADTPKDTKQAIEFGAEGIGLFRTEHMFYGEGSDKPLFLLRKMIMSKDLEERKAALNDLSVYVKKDVKATMEVLKGYPLTIRLIDPPLHEFVPQSDDKLKLLAQDLGITLAEVKKRGDALHENNPMLGHRGIRLGITYPEVSEMQIRAILEAAGELSKEGVKAFPEIMIPVTCTKAELDDHKKIVDRIHTEVCIKLGIKKVAYMFGTMIEIPRAALQAGKMAETAEFFSFGTNDLTQMTFGFSRDDIGGFLPDYLTKKILPADPFQTIDQDGVGELIKLGIERGRGTRGDLKVGICGEHGGDPDSVKFCHRVGMNYVSCSPFRVPIARLAAAQAAIESKKTDKGVSMVKKGRGRPAKADKAVIAPKKGRGRPAKAGKVVVAAPKKGRGRPAKAKVEVVALAPKKGRGRPAKAAKVVVAAPKKGRGRPAKAAKVVVAAPKKGRGRPAKVVVVALKKGPGRPAKAAPVAGKRKAGRPRKNA